MAGNVQQGVVFSKRQAEALTYLESPKYSHISEVFYGGAAGGGKTFLMCHWQIARRIQYPGTRGFIGRKVFKDLKLTTLRRFFEEWEKWYAPYVDVTIKPNFQDGVIYFSNGSEIITRDLESKPRDPEYNYLGSLELTDACIDELTEIEERAYDILSSRIRYKLINGNKKILAASNPARNWVKRRYISDDNDVTVKLPEHMKFVQALVTDNPDKTFVETYTASLEKLPAYDRARLLKGDWTIQLNETPFFPAFGSHHISEVEHLVDPNYPVWLAFDFNIDPTTALVGQMMPGKGCRILKEFQVKGGTEKLCNVIRQSMDYPIAGYKICGDHSGNSGSTSAGVLEGGQYNTDYQIIRKVLRVGMTSLVNTQQANKKHVHSYGLCDQFLSHVPFTINPSCKVLISDLRIAQRTEKGTLRKDRDNFKMDAADAFRYWINAMFNSRFRDMDRFINGIRPAK